MYLLQVSYFLSRAQRWRDPPILYEFLQLSLKDESRIQHHVIAPLLKELESSRRKLKSYSDDAKQQDAYLSIAEACFCRAYVSLKCLLDNPTFFSVSKEQATQITLILKVFQDRTPSLYFHTYTPHPSSFDIHSPSLLF